MGFQKALGTPKTQLLDFTILSNFFVLVHLTIGAQQIVARFTNTDYKVRTI